MAAKSAGPQSLGDALQDATQAIARALSTPEAADPKVQQGLTKLLQITSMMARTGGQPPGGGAAPGAAPPGGTPPGAGMGPPGGGAANPAMPSLTGGQMPPTPPGAGGTSNIPQPSSDELRRLIAQGAG